MTSGGSELHAKKITKYIKNNYFWVSLGIENRKNFLEINGLKKKIFLKFRIFKIFYALNVLSEFINENKISIVYAIGMYPSFLASILKLRHNFKLIITRRGEIRYFELLKYFYLLFFIYILADKIETNSKSIFEKFKKNLFFKKKVYFIQNLVEKKIFVGPFKRLIEKKKTILGFALNIRPVKDPDLILKIVDIVCKKTTYKFLIVGRDRQNFWKKLSRKYKKRVIWIKSINHEKMINFYKSIDFLLITSKSEGSPNTIPEALSNGVPTISVPIKAMNGLIINNYNGIISTGRSPPEFLTAILKARNIKRKLSKNAKLFFRKNFDIEKNINKLRAYF